MNFKAIGEYYKFRRGWIDLEHRAYLNGIPPLDIPFHSAMRNYIENNTPETPNHVADSIGTFLAIMEYATMHPVTSIKISIETPTENDYRKRFAKEYEKKLKEQGL